MKMLARAALGLLALFAWAIGAAPACAQRVTLPPTSLGAADSTPLIGSVTSSAATATSGAAAFASGSAIAGPLTPLLGRDIRVVLKGTWVGAVAIGTSSAANACAVGSINQLTAAGSLWGSFTSNANEVVDTPTLADVVYCVTATITSGTLTYAVRQ